MKSFISTLFLSLLLVLGTTQMQAQTAGPFALTSIDTGLELDTVTDAGTATLVSPVIASFYDVVGLQVKALKISGTAAGTIVVQYSMDGTNYFTTTDTILAVTNVTPAQIGYKDYLAPSAKYFRVRWTGTGTMAGSISAKIIARRKP